MKRIYLFSVIFFCIFIDGCAPKARLEVYDLKCEGLTNPLGIDKTVPRFNWKISSSEKGTQQSAFQLLVASDITLLSENKADLWNSEKVFSGESIMVPYNGEALGSASVAWWKVRIWDEAGNASPWSEPANFSVGLLGKNDWKASYIAFNTDAGYSESPQLYSSFEVNADLRGYYIHVNSLGYHEVYVNGEKVSPGVLTPAVSEFKKRSLINTYDISPFLKKGKNDLIIWLGSGWYTEGLPGVVNNGPVVRAQLEKVQKKNREIVCFTDSNWKGRKSSYTRHGNWRSGRFGGEIVDGEIAKNDLAADNPQNPWQPVVLIDVPEHEASPQMTELNAITETIVPVSITALSPDTFLVDMGKNFTGWIEFRFPKLADSQRIRMEYNDFLDSNNKFRNKNRWDEYVASGDGQEVFTNKFNYQAFRYMRVVGLSEFPDAGSIKGFLVHTDFESASGFECSDPDLNAIHDMLFYTLQCLSIGGDFVDCPQIERLGYGGDGNASTVTAQTMFNLGPLYNNWLQAWADVIREDGGMPHTAPNPYRAGGGPYWCGFIITASWQTYLHYGDTLVLEKYYPVMQKWLGYVDKYTVDGLLKKWPDTDYRGWYLGDWATPEGIDQTNEASVDVVNNSFIAICFDNMERIAGVLGKTEDAKLYAQKKSDLQKIIHERFFDEKDNTYGTGTQVDLAFPLISGVVPEDLYRSVVEAFYNETVNNRNGHLATGLVGLPVITEWVTKNREANLMYSMLKKRDYPGFLYMIDNGATTTWEHWNGERSHIHNCYNGIGSWFYQALGGIRPDENVPAYRKVLIQPQIPEGLIWAKSFKETPFGKLSVSWSINNGVFELDVEIPVGVEAEVELPGDAKQFLLDGIEQERADAAKTALILKSGKYQISSKLQ
jgi:alpha-L-rhamnosidase